MAKLKSSNTQPAAQVGVRVLPKQRKYPMEDRATTTKPKSSSPRKSAGKLSPAQAAGIRAKAKRLLGK